MIFKWKRQSHWLCSKEYWRNPRRIWTWEQRHPILKLRVIKHPLWPLDHHGRLLDFSYSRTKLYHLFQLVRYNWWNETIDRIVQRCITSVKAKYRGTSLVKIYSIFHKFCRENTWTLEYFWIEIFDSAEIFWLFCLCQHLDEVNFFDPDIQRVVRLSWGRGARVFGTSRYLWKNKTCFKLPNINIFFKIWKLLEKKKKMFVCCRCRTICPTKDVATLHHIQAGNPASQTF